MVVAGGERKYLIEVLALDPQLIFAGSVASVFAAFEHGDDNSFDLNWLCGGRGLGRKKQRENGEHHQK
jgi:hypothetical protein